MNKFKEMTRIIWSTIVLITGIYAMVKGDIIHGALLIGMAGLIAK